MLATLKYNRYSAALVNRYYDIRLSKLKSFIFVATTGRSGTQTLVDIFSRVANCTALHEPYPIMHDRILHAASQGDEQQVSRFYKVRKSVNIRRASIGSEYYVEANHLFIKTFIEQAASDLGRRLKVIHLVRDPTKVANSIYSLQDQPGTERGNKWWLDYRAPTNLIFIPDILDGISEFNHPYYKALWYWFETEAKIAHWKQKLPNTPFVLFNTEDFSDKDQLDRLFQSLGISVPRNFSSQINNTKSNARSLEKVLPPISEVTARDMVQTFKALLIEKELPVPATLSHYE